MCGLEDLDMSACLVITGSKGTTIFEHDRIVRADLKTPSVLELETQPQDIVI